MNYKTKIDLYRYFICILWEHFLFGIPRQRSNISLPRRIIWPCCAFYVKKKALVIWVEISFKKEIKLFLTFFVLHFQSIMMIEYYYLSYNSFFWVYLQDTQHFLCSEANFGEILSLLSSLQAFFLCLSYSNKQHSPLAQYILSIRYDVRMYVLW